MAVETHAVHVEHFALEPVQSLENRHTRRQRLILGRAHFEAHALVVVDRVELVDHVEALVAARVVHALSAVSVYIDVVFVRILIAAASISGALLLAIAAVATIRFSTDLAIPGWATIMAGDLAIVLLLAIVLVVVTELVMLSSRSWPPIVPAEGL